MNLSKDTRFFIGLMFVLVAVTVVLALTRGNQEPPAPELASDSSAPTGALALKLWTRELGYRVNENLLGEFEPPARTDIIFMLQPYFITEDELLRLDEWVKEGGTLIATGNQYTILALMDYYTIDLVSLVDDGSPVRPSPLLGSPVLLDLNYTEPRLGLASDRDDVVTLVHQGETTLVLSFEQGKGRVILSTLTRPFSNEGLKEAGNPELVLNILGLAGSGKTIWFDEWHHDKRLNSIAEGPAEFLRKNPVGRAITFTVLILALALFLQGRAFGRHVPLPQELKRRGALEHVTGVANLSRRAAHRTAVLTRYHHRLKRKLGHRYRIDPNMDDAAYVEALAGYNPALDKERLLNILKHLKRSKVSESEMVRIAAEAAKWIDE